MATKYTLYFSDTGKTPFDLQAYTTNGPVSPSVDALMVGASAKNTTLQLYGKGRQNYGEDVFQNMVYMLENFANSTPPVLSLEGQVWYNNNTTELFVRNDDADDSYGGSPIVHPGWDAIILATGSSAMTGELILVGNPSDDLGAAPKQYIDAHTTGVIAETLHLSSDQNTFLDGLNLPTLTSAEANFLIGVTSGIQAQLDDKLSRSVHENMNLGINLTFNGGEVRGLPTVPTALDAATSQQYVLDQVAAGVAASGDGVLSSTQWLNTGIGTPAPDISETTLRLTITNAGSGSPVTTTDIDVLGISRYGHTHLATEVAIDNSFDAAYGTNTQTAIEYAASEIDLLKTGGTAPTATIAVQRIFVELATPLTVAGSPIDTFETQNHTADDNRISLSINGVKQYANTRGTQGINYSSVFDAATTTGLNGGTTYNFDISVDGGSITTITVNPAGSPTVDISTHGALVTAVNDALTTAAIDATFSIDSLVSQIFTSHTSGTGSTISITDPGGSPNVYLFAGGSPIGLDNFVSVGIATAGITADFMETDSLGIQILPNQPTSYVVFNYDIPVDIPPTKIESLLYV